MERMTKEQARESLHGTTERADKIIFVVLKYTTGKAQIKMFVTDRTVTWETTFLLSCYFKAKFNSNKLITTLNTYNLQDTLKELISDINFYNYNIIEV